MEFLYEHNRIYLTNEAGRMVAEVAFPAETADTVDIRRTFVDESLRGQGVAGKLMEAAAQYLQKNGKKIRPTCSYAVKWFSQHPEYQELLV